MFKKKVDIEDIKAFTGATKEEIEEVRKSMKRQNKINYNIKR